MAAKQSIKKCCEELAACREAEDLDGACEAVAALGKRGGKVVMGSVQEDPTPEDLDECEAVLAKADTKGQARAASGTPVEAPAGAVPPALWPVLFEAARILLQWLRDRRQQHA